MYRNYLFPILLLVSVFIGATNASEVINEQINGPERTWLSGGVRLGMPGLANILKHADQLEYAHFEDYLPWGDDKLVIPLKHVVSYGGKEYRHLTVASGGRIFLGDYGKYVLPEDGFDGSYPYVKSVVNPFVPVANASNIPVRWRMFSDHGDVFTVVEFGPFNVLGHSDNLLCQVSFYDDGEIQVQHWNLDRSIYHVIKDGDYGSLVEGSYMLSPYVFNGGKRVSLSENDFSEVYSIRMIKIFEYGEFREGWIAKPFDSNDPMFKFTDEGDYRRRYIDVDFGLAPYSGGVIAYDHARENPVVGSFQKLDFQVSSSEEPDTEPVYLWYFNEKVTNYASKTDEAGYPYLVNNRKILSDKARSLGASEHCLTSGVSPCAYLYSWKTLKDPSDFIDTVIAPAIKMQVVHDPNDLNYKGRKIRIHYIRFKPMQPRSYQFRPTGIHEIKYESKSKDSNADDESVGYLEIAGSKAPLRMPEGTNVEAKIKLPPGYEIARIEINGYVGYDDSYKNPFVAGVGMSLDVDVDPSTMGNHPYVPLRGFYIEKLATQNEMQVRFPLMRDVTISVTYRECSEKKLPTVVPSYVKSEVYLDPSNKMKTLETYSVKDGFGQVVQTQTALNNGLFSVSAKYLDDADNTQYAPKSYVVKKSSYSFENMFCYKCVRKSAAYYDGQTNVSKERVDSYGFPYTERNYHYGENTALVGDAAGMGDASFERGRNSVKTWKLPLRTKASTEFFDVTQIKDDFANNPEEVGNVFNAYYYDRLNALTDGELSVDGNASYPFELTVNLSLDGVFTQSISDAAGNVVATWMTHDGEILITRNEYDDATSLLKKSFVEGHSGFETTYEYDYAGRLVTTVSPDRGRSETKYDSKNRVRFTRDARQIANSKSNGDYFNIFIYDEQDRLIKMGEVRGQCNGCSFDSPDTDVPEGSIHLLSEKIYGKPSVGVLTNRSPLLSNSLAANIVNSIEGVGLNDVGATISYDGNGNVNTIKMASYDRLGRITKKWIVNLVDNGTPTIEISYTYSKSGLVTNTDVSEWNESLGSWNSISKREMEYASSDRFNHLEKIYEKNLNNNDKKLLAFYEYNDVGTLEKTTYYDKGQEILTKVVDEDIYGRPTNIVYKDDKGDNLYSEILEYKAPLINRLSSIRHSWADNTAQKKDAKESFDYDDLGRLATFATDMGGMTDGYYTYDILGRLTAKSEAGSLISYGYVDGSYRPVSLSVNGVPISRALEYDASGNLWLDGNNKVAYEINALGLPERVARFNSYLPTDLSYVDFMDGKDYVGEDGVGGPGGEWATVGFKYDDGGNRIFEKSVTRGSMEYGRLTVPEVGVFERKRNSAYELNRLDLVGGGFRLGLDGEALFPMTDAQGNVRGYISRSGWKGMHAYYPFGSTVDFVNQQGEDERRWQGKEFDGEHGKYYFGARYYDPFLGLWMSPDPAGQFMNPYSYGGDPLNYVDPTGLWSLGFGLVFGWDSERGWHLGFGFAADLTNGKGDGIGFNLSYTWHDDGSSSFNIGSTAHFWIDFIDINLGFSYSYNTYSGSVLSANGGICFGEKEVACAGVEAGGSLYWDKNGDFMGGAAYAGVYAEVAGGFSRVSGGYDLGLLGMEGRGLNAGGTIAGLHGEVSQRDGGSWGFEERLYYGIGNNVGRARFEDNDDIVSSELWNPSLGRFGHITFGDQYDVSNDGLRKALYDKIISILKNSSNPEDIAVRKEVKRALDANKNLSTKNFLRAGRALRRFGFELVDRMGDHNDKSTKVTFRKAGSSEYGNIEFGSRVWNNDAYSSYNYGNNFITHFLIDYLGWKGRGY